jgi:hypothetical protein
MMTAEEGLEVLGEEGSGIKSIEDKGSEVRGSEVRGSEDGASEV